MNVLFYVWRAEGKYSLWWTIKFLSSSLFYLYKAYQYNQIMKILFIPNYVRK